MFGENKNLNLKDNNSTLPSLPVDKGEEERGGGLSYKKTNKLITALYMVTDIIDKEEPIRNKLRTLGVGIISDMNSIGFNHIGHTASGTMEKISEIMSFLDIASAVNIISGMNCGILRKEFAELNQSILSSQTVNELSNQNQTINREINLSEFFANSSSGQEKNAPLFSSQIPPIKGQENYKGHTTRIGVQKGSTLLQALSDKINIKDSYQTNTQNFSATANVFDALKKQRRDNIISIIKNIPNGATIKDIKDKAQTSPEQYKALASCSEKTLQRELVSIVRDGVLNKTGEKRWSRYRLPITN